MLVYRVEELAEEESIYLYKYKATPSHGLLLLPGIYFTRR